jgi:hypothetical protein
MVKSEHGMTLSLTGMELNTHVQLHNLQPQGNIGWWQSSQSQRPMVQKQPCDGSWIG